MEFNNDQLNIILGALNCYMRIENLPNDIRNKAENIRENIKDNIKRIKTYKGECN